MSMEVGRIDLGLDVNKKAFNSQLNGIAGGAQKSVMGAFKPLGKMIGVALGGAAVASFVKSSLKLGSDLQEVQNVVDTTFKQMNGSVNEFANNAMKQFGLSETVAKKYMGTFGAMSKSMGYSEKQAYNMAESVTALTGDVASFYNLSSDEAYTKLKSIWTGETESLKDLGVVMTQVNLDQYALNNGFGKTTKNMTEQEKVMLRYQYVMSQLSLAHGDFARNSDSWANQTKVLSLQFDSLKATLGQGFINLFTPIIKMINTLLGKLQTLANAFKSFTEMITGKKSDTSGLGSVVADVASATSATDGLGASTEGVGNAAKKAAKQIKKSLASFDQVNQLGSNDKDASGGGGGAAGGGSGIDTGAGLAGDMATGTEESAGRMVTALDKVKAKLLELVALSGDGFKLGLGDINFSEILGHISGIGKSLKDIFTDPKVQKAASNWVKSMAKSLGKITGSAASIGATVAELFVGSIDKYMDQNKQFLKDKIVEMFNLSAEGKEIYANFAVAIADIFTVFRGESAKQIGADLIAIFINSFLSITTLSAQLGNDIMAAITQPIIDNKDAIKTALDGTLGIISEIVGGIKDFISDTFDSIKSSYDEYIAPAIKKFSSGFEKVFKAILDAYNDYFAPTFEAITKKIRELINGPVGELVQSITDFVGKLVDGIATIWDKTIAPFLAWLMATFAPGVSGAIGDTADVFIELAGTVAEIASDILEALGGIIDFVVGVFTGDWKKAWEGIKTFFGGIIEGIKTIIKPIDKFFSEKFSGAWTNVKKAFGGVKEWFKQKWVDITSVFNNIPTWFKNKFTAAWTNVKNVFSTGGKIFNGIKDGIAETFKTVVNGLVSGINTIISVPFRKINSMLNTIRGVGINTPLGDVKPFSGLWSYNPLSIPQIPKLAQGGYVGANQPQLAMIGDNRREGEVVAPESKLRQMALEAVRMAGGAGGLTEEALYRVMARVFKEFMHFYIGDEDLARHVNRGNEMLDLRFSPVKGGAR